jgi:hypothetical protein
MRCSMPCNLQAGYKINILGRKTGKQPSNAHPSTLAIQIADIKQSSGKTP